VTVEAQFKVGEYEIVVLSTEDSTSLETWLDQNDYNIPDGAAPYFEPYVQSSMYFFVAKVDVTEVAYENGKAVLSPLRFSYDSPDFTLPVRLGMINSAGKQDLMAYILGRDQRYEVANMDNITIPTNIEVVDDVRNDFGGFYQALFSRTMQEHPGAAVTEYSWPASGCDPCPGPVTLQPEDLETLGLDVIGDGDYWSWVVTRIHVQYEKDEVGEDLVFREATPIIGGREVTNEDGKLEEGATPADWNNFQARYIIRHRWDKAVECADPTYGIWGADPDSDDPYGQPPVTSNPSPNTSGGDVFASNSSKPVEQLVTEDIPEIGVIASGPGPKSDLGGGCSAANPGSTLGGAGLLALLGFVGFGIRRRRR
jgi:MYXO-CTERM domain-containing protein